MDQPYLYTPWVAIVNHIAANPEAGKVVEGKKKGKKRDVLIRASTTLLLRPSPPTPARVPLRFRIGDAG